MAKMGHKYCQSGKNGLKNGKTGGETTKIAKIAKGVGNLCSSVSIRGWFERFGVARFEPGQHGGCLFGKTGERNYGNCEDRERGGKSVFIGVHPWLV